MAMTDPLLLAERLEKRAEHWRHLDGYGLGFYSRQDRDTDIAVAQALRQFAWRPISDAPTDGAHVLLYWPTMSIQDYPEVGVNHGDGYGWSLVANLEYGEVFPTHWQPLPAPPQTEPVKE